MGRPRSRVGRGGGSDNSRSKKNLSDFNSANIAPKKKFKDEDPYAGSEIDRQLY